MRTHFVLLIVIFLLALPPMDGFASEQCIISAQRLQTPPRIDGILEEDLWQRLPLLTDFTQYNPHNGRPASQPTEARIGYDDRALYIGINCQDTQPDRIMREMRPRDNYGEMNSDLISIIICPYNDGLNSFYLMVSAAGIQADSKFSGDNIDQKWDAVWESAVSLNPTGWSAEIRIPYSVLRFSSRPVQDWGINIWRWLARKREWSCWQPVSRDIQGWWKHMGLLEGIQNLNPPLRLSLTPYLSGYIEKGWASHWDYSSNGGIDLKYGITGGFTLDLTLIPDFGQIQSDDELLNLSPYEIQFNEKRQFFTEGSELFGKGDIYYSRRIGDLPVGYHIVSESFKESEVLTHNPEQTKLINATKLSGRTNKGLGIGFLNSMTAPSYASVSDYMTGEKRRILTQAFTNYNFTVLDQTLFGNSSISISNSNVARKGYSANVTAGDFHLSDRSKTYRLKGTAAFSRIKDEGALSSGFKTCLEAGKYGGKWQYQGFLSIFSDGYDQNDLGYLKRNNEVNSGMRISCNLYKPFGIFLSLENNLEIVSSRMYRPNTLSHVLLSYTGFAEFQNHYDLEWEISWAPYEIHDYWETRTPNRHVALPRFLKGNMNLGSDPRQRFSLKIQLGGQGSMGYDFPVKSQKIGIRPLLRLNDRLNILYDGLYVVDENQPGFIKKAEAGDEIVFGRRNRKTMENILEASYIFSHRASLTARVRHYWSAVEYKEFFQLLETGRLGPSGYRGEHDINYNAFNLDMTFRWIFAPGSEILINWKNAISVSGKNPALSYWDNLRNTLDSPQTNSFSIKILYYLDGLFR